MHRPARVAEFIYFLVFGKHPKCCDGIHPISAIDVYTHKKTVVMYYAPQCKSHQDVVCDGCFDISNSDPCLDFCQFN